MENQQARGLVNVSNPSGLMKSKLALCHEERSFTSLFLRPFEDLLCS